ncbi:MAG: hypothetical protein ACI9GM_000687 [Salibacteraceae bacterium]|jgi:hypothetical protein
MKKQLLYIVLFLIQGIGFTQEEEDQFSSSVIKNEHYYIDPISYLKNIDESLIETGVLIDREQFNDIILEVDGVENVTTIDFKDWLGIFRGLRYGNFDTNDVSPIDSFEYVADLQYRHNRTYAIGIMDYEFNRIKQSALENGELVATDEGLIVNEASSESFSEHRAVISCAMTHHVFGDEVRFYVGDFYYYSNINSEVKQLLGVEIDFDNGEGFQTIEMNNERVVQYGAESGFVHLVTRLTYQFSGSEETEQVYAHSTFFRTGSNTVPMPDDLPNQNMATKTSSTDLKTGYYPEPIKRTVKKVEIGKGGSVKLIWTTILDYSNTKIEYNILYSPQNVDKSKLRRPVIICDGFDPGNQRDYFSTNKPYDEDRLYRDTDYRGLYQLINGDPSPWYSGQPSANLITKLRNDGYDIVVVNFLNGAGDIIENAGTDGLRGFLNDVINGSTYRDNKTEEAVLIGPSMGGIITRLALISMQEADPVEDPYVKMWISFDSPQKGASIPVGVQQTIKFFTNVTNDDSPLDALKTTAAKQMLLRHFDSEPHSWKFDQLYDDFLQDKYPIYSKNYSITNGGTSKLHSYDGTQIIHFHARYKKVRVLKGLFWFNITAFGSTWAKAYAHNNSSSNNYRELMLAHDIKGFKNYKSGIQIGYDNAPGGWYATPYLINCRIDNKYQKSENDIKYTRATFMTTTSAFGIEADYNNVYNTWEDYTGIMQNIPGKEMTPFDVVYGMDGICEEHVRISEATGKRLTEDILQVDFLETERPRVRQGLIINQKVNGPIAYTAKEAYTFGGNGNTYTAQSHADINMKAGGEIVWLPGFSTVDGADIMAEITNVDYSTVFMKTNVGNTDLVDYTQPSPYWGQVFNYGAVTGIEDINGSDMITIYPNPVKNELKLEVKGFEAYANLELHIYSNTGKLVYSVSINAYQQVVVNVTTFAQGVYFYKIVSNQKELYKTEFVKIK